MINCYFSDWDDIAVRNQGNMEELVSIPKDNVIAYTILGLSYYIAYLDNDTVKTLYTERSDENYAQLFTVSGRCPLLGIYKNHKLEHLLKKSPD